MPELTLHSVSYHNVSQVTVREAGEKACELVALLSSGETFVSKKAFESGKAEQVKKQIENSGYLTSKNLYENWNNF